MLVQLLFTILLSEEKATATYELPDTEEPHSSNS